MELQWDENKRQTDNKHCKLNHLSRKSRERKIRWGRFPNPSPWSSALDSCRVVTDLIRRPTDRRLFCLSGCSSSSTRCSGEERCGLARLWPSGDVVSAATQATAPQAWSHRRMLCTSTVLYIYGGGGTYYLLILPFRFSAFRIVRCWDWLGAT